MDATTAAAAATTTAAAAAATCRCGHAADAHEHFRAGTDCGTCPCTRYGAPSRLQRVFAALGPQRGAAGTVPSGA